MKWEDSASEAGWRPAKHGETSKIVSLGFAISSDASCITITHSVDDSGHVFGSLAIPWATIYECEVINYKEVDEARQQSDAGVEQVSVVVEGEVPQRY